jgi:putative transposase
MSRLRRIEDQDRIFFITTNLAKHAAHFSETERSLLLRQLEVQRSAGQFLLFAFVAMPDHLHALLAPSSQGLIAIMREFKSCTGQQLIRLRNVRGPLWQPRYFDFIARRVGDFWNKVEYIHNNPVEAGLAKRPEDWPWSSAPQYAGRNSMYLPVDSPDLPIDRNAWLYPAPWRRL